MSWLSQRRQEFLLLREGNRILSHQLAFSRIGDAMMDATLAPNGLQKTMVFPNTPLTNTKVIWFNARIGPLDLERIVGKIFQRCLRDGRISEQNFEPERRPHHLGGRPSRHYHGK